MENENKIRVRKEISVRVKGILHSFFIKNIFYDKMDLRLFYFHMTMVIAKLPNSVV